MVVESIEQAKKDFLPPPGWKRNPILLKLKSLDEFLSYRLAWAFDEASFLGEFRQKLIYFEYSAHTLVCFAFAVFFWWMSMAMKSRAFFTNILLAMFIDVFVVAMIKSIARRRRPGVSKAQYDANPSSRNLSFPSGFVSRATLITLILMDQDFFPLIPISFITWASVMLLTKIFLGRFFICDALAAVPIGYVVYKFLELVWLDPEDVIALEAFFGGQLGDG